jgi:SAM-dependent methyltransferase
MTSDNVSPLYNQSGAVPLASRISQQVRQQIFDLFMTTMQPTPTDRILDVGVTNDEKHPESNFFEKIYPHKAQITCVGTEDGSYLERQYPGISFQLVVAGEPLPYADNAFDIAFSNAVIEHVGDTAAQRQFLKEVCRVGKRVFVTTPHRWFPVEHHTGLPLLHYLPKPLYRRLLRNTPYEYWSYEENLNALTQPEFLGLFEDPSTITTKFVGPLRSNMVAYS